MSVETDFESYLADLSDVPGGNEKRHDTFRAYRKGLMLLLVDGCIEPD